jgi:hypothetical protein
MGARPRAESMDMTGGRQGPGGPVARDDPARVWAPVRARVDAALAEVADQISAVRAARALLGDDEWIARLIDAAVASLDIDARQPLPLRASDSEVRSGIVVARHPALSVTLDVVHAAKLAVKKNNPRPGSIGFTGDISIARFVRSGGAVLSWWEIPPIGLDFSAATAGTCRQTGHRAVADGDMVEMDGRRESFIIEAARGNLLLVSATIRTEAPVSVEYDAATGAYLGCSAASDRDSRLQLVSSLARLLEAREVFPAIAALLDEPSFFVRWHAMRELIAIDAEAALPYLRMLADHDPHAEVRCAARATLDLLLPDERKAA